MSNEQQQPQSQQRRRPTKALLEHNLTEIYRLMIAGMTNHDIMHQLNLNGRTFRRYVKTIRDRIIADQLAKRQEYFLDDIKTAKERLLMAKRYNLRTINSEDASYAEKTEALKLDAAITMTLLKLEYEGTVYLRVLNLDVGNRIETPKLIQRQRDIIRSEAIKPAITAAAASTIENAAIGKSDTIATEDQASVY
jgi:DNA-binding CsgD family transcriptional regulator